MFFFKLSGFSPDDVCVKVTDLGESILLASSYIGRDNLQNPVWMAPEILRNEAYDHFSDVYSYGIILWELLTREFPFDEYPVASSNFTYLVGIFFFSYNDFKLTCFFHAQLEDAIIDGLRPSIPKTCPKEYSTLIKECWKNNTKKRPTFTKILRAIEEMQQLNFSDNDAT